MCIRDSDKPGEGGDPETGNTGSAGSGKGHPDEGSHGSDASSATGAQTHSTGLPRTGAEVMGILAAGLVLVAGGAAVLRSRRVSR